MPDFDFETSLKEEIMGLVEIQTHLRKRASQLEMQFGEIEHEYNSVQKLRGFAIAELDRKRQALDALTKADS